MARATRVPIGSLVAILLVALVVALATLQYRWLGKVSEAEKEQMRRSLAQRAREFADDFDGEVSRLYRALRADEASVAAREWSAWSAEVDRWRANARDPRLLKAIYLAEPSAGGHRLRAWDDARRAFAEAPLADWPANLEPVRRQLALPPGASHLPPPESWLPRGGTSTDARRTIVAFGVVPLNLEVPALIVPVTASKAAAAEARSPGSGAAEDAAPAPGRAPAAVTVAVTMAPRAEAFVVAELDADRIRRTILPALVERHFPASDASNYRVAIVSPAGDSLFARGFRAGAAVDPAKADSVTPFFTLRLELAHALLAGAGGDAVFVRTDEALARSAGPRPRVPQRGGAEPPAEPGTEPAGPAGGERVSVFFESRVAAPPEGSAQAGGAAGRAGDARSGSAAGLVRIVRPGWRVVIQHGAGSLDAAVTQLRRRNLALSFGILGVLAAGIVLVMANARRSEQLAARQMDFVAAVSHELRTPLAVIRSAAQNLSAGVIADPAQARRYGALIDDEGRRLADMVEQVLDYAGIGNGRLVGEKRPVDFASIVEEVLAAAEPALAAAGFALESSWGEGAEVAGDGAAVPAVAGDAEALRRVVQNLVGNALKHGADGKWLGVEVRAVPSDAPREVILEVSDRGRGIEPSELAHIFEPFYRGRRAVEQQVHGNGIGLSLVKRIVEAHGGRVAARSAPGQGTTFTVTLPAAAEPGLGAGARAGAGAGGAAASGAEWREGAPRQPGPGVTAEGEPS